MSRNNVMLSDMGDIPIVLSDIPIVMLSDIHIVTKQHAGPSISLASWVPPAKQDKSPGKQGFSI